MSFLVESLDKYMNAPKKKEARRIHLSENMKNLRSILTESVNDVKAYSNIRSEFEKTLAYSKALQEAIEGQYPDKCWHEVTSCNIQESLMLNGNNTESVIMQIVESIDDDTDELIAHEVKSQQEALDSGIVHIGDHVITNGIEQPKDEEPLEFIYRGHFVEGGFDVYAFEPVSPFAKEIHDEEVAVDPDNGDELCTFMDEEGIYVNFQNNTFVKEPYNNAPQE